MKMNKFFWVAECFFFSPLLFIITINFVTSWGDAEAALTYPNTLVFDPVHVRKFQFSVIPDKVSCVILILTLIYNCSWVVYLLG